VILIIVHCSCCRRRPKSVVFFWGVSPIKRRWNMHVRYWSSSSSSSSWRVSSSSSPSSSSSLPSQLVSGSSSSTAVPLLVSLDLRTDDDSFFFVDSSSCCCSSSSFYSSCDSAWHEWQYRQSTWTISVERHPEIVATHGAVDDESSSPKLYDASWKFRRHHHHHHPLGGRMGCRDPHLLLLYRCHRLIEKKKTSQKVERKKCESAVRERERERERERPSVRQSS
jgi:hypothetical protein